jgi:pimeloyl-ACP methyl ester carboxylesterase
MTIHQTDFGAVETLEFGAAGTGSLVVLLHATATGPGSLARLGKTLAASGHHVVIPALHRYGGTWVEVDGTAIERSARAVGWVLDTFEADGRALFGQSMGGLTALLGALAAMRPIERLMLYEPMVMQVLDPRDGADMREREWDRALVRAVMASIGTDDYEAAIAAFIAAWNEAAWGDIPQKTRDTILRSGEGLAAEMRAVNDMPFDAAGLSVMRTPTLLLGGGASPPLAGRILDRLERCLPNTKRVRFDGLGHMGPVLAPSLVAEELAAFLV